MNDFKFGVVVFPGSNCEQDVVYAIKHLGYQADYVWHRETSLDGFDAVILPGGSSYGNYLRSGAIASLSPIMTAIKDFALQGKPVLAISNGFAILTEAGLLPGVLLQNQTQKYISQTVSLRVETSVCQWLNPTPGAVLTMPISHGSGNYVVDELTLGRMETMGQIVLRYTQADGSLLPDPSSVGGAVDNIAAVCNERGNVLGMLPYPERVVDGLAGTDGSVFFSTIIKHLEAVI